MIQKQLILSIWVALTCAAAAAEPKETLLWPTGAPGSEGKTETELVTQRPGGERSVSRIHQPSLTPYLPAEGKATGTAVVVLPGGGHRLLAIDHEGYRVAQWLSEQGIAAFVLKYRLARETNSIYTIEGHALPDTQRAIQLVRSRAKEWRINSDRIGVMGFSAGGELAARASMTFQQSKPDAADVVERQSSKPNFQALVYPGGTKIIEPTKDSPPAFLICGNDDRPDISEGLAAVYLKFKQAGVPAELHIYAKTGHGFGLRNSNPGPVKDWPIRFQEWLRTMAFE